MERKRYIASPSANIIRNWLGKESEDDDSYCSLAESSDDEVDDILIADAAETDDSSLSINQHAATHYAKKKVQWDPIDIVALKAFFGILYLIGVSKGNHENIRNLWSDGPITKSFFKATMSVT